jgi:histidyl-tRNA synthetase
MGIARGDYVIKVNNRKVLDGLMEAIGLGGDANAGRRLTVLRAIDKLDRLGVDGVRLLLGSGRKDESGDFTKGAGLDARGIDVILSLIDPETSAAGLESKLAGSEIGQQGRTELEAIGRLIAAAGYDSDRIRIDPTVVRGLEYYTGPVFEAELTFEIEGDDGKPIRFGSVGGGGRYDGLVARFRGEPVPSTGFSIGVSRLFAALKAIKSPIVSGSPQRGPVIVLVLDKTPEDMARYQSFVSALRREGIAAELYLGSSGMNAQLKYADKRSSACAVIQGSNERDAGQIAIRDLILGAELAASTKDRADYLELRAKAQFTAPEADLVKAVKEVLARHG